MTSQSAPAYSGIGNAEHVAEPRRCADATAYRLSHRTRSPAGTCSSLESEGIALTDCNLPLGCWVLERVGGQGGAGRLPERRVEFEKIHTGLHTVGPASGISCDKSIA